MRAILLSTASAIMALTTTPALAQEAPPASDTATNGQAGISDIVVTARRKEDRWPSMANVAEAFRAITLEEPVPASRHRRSS